MTEESGDDRDSRGTEAKRSVQTEALRPAWQEGVDSGDAGVLDFAKLRDEVNLAEAIRRRFEPFGGVDDLELPPREPARDPPDFDTADYDQPPRNRPGSADGAPVAGGGNPTKTE